MKKNECISWEWKVPRLQKVFRIMKLTVFLLLFSVISVFASKSYSQTKVLNLDMKNSTVKEVLRNIEKQSEFVFMYSEKLIDVNREVSVNVKNKKISEVLDELFAGTDVSYKVKNRFVLLTTPEVTGSDLLAQQQKSVSGKVTDSGGQPLPGVTVVVKGTTQGTVTNADGEYSLTNIPEEATLVFSFVGMRTQEVVVGSQTSINMTMEEEFIGIDEVVAIGYGTQKKVNLTGAVNSLNSVDIEKRQVGQSSMLLQGVSPGVTVTQESGKPGGDGGTIRIRGIGTLNDANPLILVDGVPMDLNNIDPSLIESISILKDAASASIYGARAANGVILVTTKRASGKEFSFKYNGYTGIKEPTNLKQRVNAVDHMSMLNLSYENIGRTPVYSEELINNYESLHKEDPLLYPDTDWYKKVYTENGFTQNHSLSFEGGNEKIKVLGTLGYYDQEAIYKHSGFERYSFRLNSDMKINPKLAFKADVFFQFMETKDPARSPVGNVNVLASHEPTFYNINGELKHAAPSVGGNPLADLEQGGYKKIQSPSLLLNLGLIYNFNEDLRLEFNYSPHLWENYTKEFEKVVEVFRPDGSKVVRNSVAELTEISDRFVNHNTWGTLNYEKAFGLHNLRLLLGASQEAYSSRWFSGFRDNFDLPQYDVLNAGDLGKQQSNGSGYEWALRSFFGRINYDFKDKYLFEANIRYDGSSRFASGNKYGVFPSFSAGWRISEESFWEPYRNVVDYLKFRLSWGQLGNQNIGYYPYDAFLQSATVIFNSSAIKGLSVADMANPDISWETTEMLNSGLDMNIYKFNVSFDYYYKKTNGILLQLDVPAYLGVTPPYQNAGVVENKGWDFSLGYNDKKDDFFYGINLSLSDVKNKILDLKGANVGGLMVNFEGYPINSFYGYEAIGYFQNDDDIENSPKQSGNIIPGSIKYKDQDDNKVIDGDDRRIIGNRIPRYTYGLNLNLGWKNFDFSMLLQGVGKRNGYLLEKGIWPFSNGSTALEMHKDYWTADNPNASFPSLSFNDSNNYQNSTFWLKDASYVRLKNIQLGYTLPQHFLDKINVDRLRFFITGENLLTFDNFWEGFDVESPVGEGTHYPQQKSYSFGINLSF
jgi:TonB-linked SusC/RagA family outer membrane protein